MSLNNTPYPFPHPKSNQLWFRRRVPQRLQPSIGRQEIRFSLQTSVVRDAVQRCRMAANVVDKLFIEAEDQYGSVKHALPARLQALQSDFNDPDALALTTGARLEEIGQLFVRDVSRRSGRLWIRIAELDETQFVKNESAWRQVPVHQELLKIGFEAFVDSQRERGTSGCFRSCV
ncbi:MAG: DUF6538 domain-containing protein [Paralcaligenes sp.]